MPPTDDLPDSLADYAERPRVGDWTLRSALVRVAQPEPLRASAVLDLVRRTDHGLARPPEGTDARAQVRRAAEELDALADALAEWAEHRSGPPPVEAIDATAAAVFGLLERAGVPARV